MHDMNCFVTLTYSQENLPAYGSLHYPDFQEFMRRLRKHLTALPRRDGEPVLRVRFFACGEYGEQLSRPHYHACLFGWRPDDLVEHTKSGSGDWLYRSNTLETLWRKGFVLVGNLSFESARYVASYCVKKVTGDLAETHYSRLDPATGEIVRLVPEFCRMSLKPGIGSTWLDKFLSDVYPLDHVVMNGREGKAPRYYDKRLKELDEVELLEMKAKREVKALASVADSTPERLKSQEIVALAKFNQRGRSLS